MSEEELMLQAQNEAQSQQEQEALAAQQAFMSQYGNRFSGDKPIGLAILNYLNQEGIDVSAADSAVQDVINKLREQSNHILESTQEYVNQLSQKAQEQQVAIKQLEADTAAAQLALNDKLNAVDQAVAGAVSATGDPNLAQEIAQSASTPIVSSDTGMPPIDAPMAPTTEASAPAPEEPAPAPAPVEPAQPAPEEAAPSAPAPTSPFAQAAPAQPEPQRAFSDERLKTIRTGLHNAMSKYKAKKAQPQGIHLASNIISACGR